MSRLLLAAIGVLAGVASIVAGVVVVFGWGWALIVGGVICALSSALLIDLEESDGEPSPASP